MMMLLPSTSDQDAESALKELMLQLSSVWLRRMVVVMVMIMVLMMMLLLLCTPDQDTESALKEMMPHVPHVDEDGGDDDDGGGGGGGDDGDDDDGIAALPSRPGCRDYRPCNCERADAAIFPRW